MNSGMVFDEVRSKPVIILGLRYVFINYPRIGLDLIRLMVGCFYMDYIKQVSPA
jgi:hypothetical protein